MNANQIKRCRMNKALFMVLITLVLSMAGTLSAQGMEWSWAVTAGGINTDYGNGISTDSGNNSYVTGYFGNTAVFGAISLVTTGAYDVYVAKQDPGGNWLWAVKGGGTSVDYGTDIETDASGNSYVTGYFEGAASFGTTTLTSSGGYDVFIAKLDANGNWLWAVRAGGTSYDAGNGIDIDASGNCYVTGYFATTATFGSTNLVSGGGDDVFVTKLNANGNWLWAVKGGYNNYETGYRITTDGNGTSYVCGYFGGVAYFGTNSISAYAGADAYVAKIDASGTWLWARRAAGGSGTDEGMNVATDTAGNIYITGYFTGTAYFGSGTLTSAGISDVFVVKYDPGGVWQWAKQAGGTGGDTRGYGIAVTGSDMVFVTGYFTYTTTIGSTTFSSSGNKDIFIAKLDSSGNWLLAYKAGLNYEDFGIAVTTDSGGNAILTGFYTLLANFGTISLSAPGHGKELFVAKLSELVSTPAQPQNLTLTRNGNDACLTWNAVTQDVNGQSISPDAYYVYISSGANPWGVYVFLGQTSGTSYSHTNALADNPASFYKVTAVKN